MTAESKAGALLVTALDEVAWLLNLRGSDISYNPVFVSYVIITSDKATLYIDEAKVKPLNPLEVLELCPYNYMCQHLQPGSLCELLQCWLEAMQKACCNHLHFPFLASSVQSFSFSKLAQR